MLHLPITLTSSVNAGPYGLRVLHGMLVCLCASACAYLTVAIARWHGQAGRMQEEEALNRCSAHRIYLAHHGPTSGERRAILMRSRAARTKDECMLNRWRLAVQTRHESLAFGPGPAIHLPSPGSSSYISPRLWPDFFPARPLHCTWHLAF